jgi:cell division protein FtsB
MIIHKSPFLRLGITIICLVLFVGLIRSIVGHINRNDVVQERREALLREEKRNQELKERLKEATSAAFIEKQAREKLGLARVGDTIILMEGSREAKGSAAEGAHSSNWKRWWRLFF